MVRDPSIGGITQWQWLLQTPTPQKKVTQTSCFLTPNVATERGSGRFISPLLNDRSANSKKVSLTTSGQERCSSSSPGMGLSTNPEMPGSQPGSSSRETSPP